MAAFIGAPCALGLTGARCYSSTGHTFRARSPLNIEKTLFEAADKMRGAMDAGEYKHVALGLLFLRYVSAAFELKHAELAEEEFADPEDPEEY